MVKFGLRFDFDENNKPPMFDKEDQRYYSFVELGLSHIEMMILLKGIYSKQRTTGFAKRLLNFMSLVMDETPDNILKNLKGYRLINKKEFDTKKGGVK